MLNHCAVRATISMTAVQPVELGDFWFACLFNFLPCLRARVRMHMINPKKKKKTAHGGTRTHILRLRNPPRFQLRHTCLPDKLLCASVKTAMLRMVKFLSPTKAMAADAAYISLLTHALAARLA
jgi:hypothetical protein